MMKTQVLGILTAFIGIVMMALSVYQVQTQPKIIAWYDMNGDGIINLEDFDLNGDGAVTWVDVQLVINTVNATTYVQRQDFNLDGKVDNADVEIIIAWMGKGKMALYDMNGDGKVDWHDLDVNNDGTVDMRDIVMVARAYGSRIGEANYDPRVDFNQDGVIDDADVNLITPYFGYPLSIFDVFNPVTPYGQLFLAGIITTILGIAVALTAKP
jgi:hypothetical protein